ncbi:MAG: homoserine dehydrogenase [Acidobacteriia bacterium]|nr:homoserine dehydrogenase [Terriglobia bacterium]
MKPLAIGLAGFGNVNRTLVELLQRKKNELRDRHGIEWRITGVGSRRIGWRVNADGFDVAELLGARNPGASSGWRGQECPRYTDWLQAAQPDVVFEATSLNVEGGQPAIDHIRAALDHGAHAITANKGPVVHAYEELRELAARRGKQFLFESTVMDGIPIFSLFRNTLPAIEVKGFKGILNSTTNVILTGMEQGLSFDESLRHAQQLGVAETDASYDIDGWDAAVKVAALVNVIMGVRFPPQKVEREGIRGLSGEAVRSARKSGMPYKLVCRAQRTESGVSASVRPEQIPLTDPMALVGGTSSIIQFETDIFPGLTITEENPGLYATAYGMLADFIRAVTP